MGIMEYYANSSNLERETDFRWKERGATDVIPRFALSLDNHPSLLRNL